jgi:pyruvate,water dikinase
MEAILKFKPKWANRKKIEAGEILERMEELKILSLKMLEPDFAIFLIKDRLHHALQDLWKALGKSELGFVESVKVENENRTLQMKQQWSGLMGILNRDPGKEAFLAKLKKGESEPEKPLTESARLAWLGFLVENGHCRTSWDIALPSWGDSPETLAPLIASSLQKPLYPAAPERETPERLLIEAGFSHELNAIKRSLKRLSEFIRIDEELHFLTGHLLQPSRALVLQASEVLRGKGLLKIESDVFFLKLNELKRALAFPDLNLSFLAARRRSGFERACENPGPFEIPPEAAKNIPPRKDAKNIVGQPMSRGQATGKVRFVEHLGEASNMERGSILVTTAPNPSFVPLYSVIGGILTQTGGLLSHGFVAARELGVPAVSGIPSFQLKEGMKVRIDGVTGLVEILSDERGNE